MQKSSPLSQFFLRKCECITISGELFYLKKKSQFSKFLKKTNIIMKKLEFINEYFFPYLLSYESFKFLFCILMFSNIINVCNWISVIIVFDMHHDMMNIGPMAIETFIVCHISQLKRIFALSFSEREQLGVILTNVNNKRSTRYYSIDSFAICISFFIWIITIIFKKIIAY